MSMEFFDENNPAPELGPVLLIMDAVTNISKAAGCIGVLRESLIELGNHPEMVEVLNQAEAGIHGVAQRLAEFHARAGWPMPNKWRVEFVEAMEATDRAAAATKPPEASH